MKISGGDAPRGYGGNITLTGGDGELVAGQVVLQSGKGPFSSGPVRVSSDSAGSLVIVEM